VIYLLRYGVPALTAAVLIFVVIPAIFRRATAPKRKAMHDKLLDIIMLVHDQAGWADLAIRAVERFTQNPYRLIVVDSASVEPATHQLFKDVKERGHTVIHLKENKSFSNGVNTGVAAGSSKYICVLNDDAIVTEGWDSALLQDATPKHVGIVGASSNYASGPQMDPTFVGEPPYLVFVCVALRREVWDQIGPMDEETFDGFSSEDIDYVWQVRKAGYKLAVSRGAFVLHAGSRTLAVKVGAHGEGGVPLTELRARNDSKYNARLIDKWGKEWVAKYQTTKKKILLVSYHPEEWTRVRFMDDFFKLRTKALGEYDFMRVTRMPIAAARNAVADYALDGGFDWILQLDDDATFPPDLLQRLFAHDKDVVCALAYQRKPPHLTCAFELGPDGMMGTPMEGIEHTGLRRVDISGFHCSLMRTEVIKRLREGLKETDGSEKVIVPGTRHYYGWFANTEIKVGEDFAFCLNLKKLGIQIHVDTELISGHIGDAIVVDEAYKKAFNAGRAP